MKGGDMTETAHLAEAIAGFFGVPNLYWFTSFPDAVKGLSAQQAACIPTPRFNSVWAVTLHLTLCQQFALAVLRGKTIDGNEFFAEGAWPSIGVSCNETDWEAAKANVLTVNQALSDCIAGLPDAALEQNLPYVGMKGYQYIHGQLAHNSHHLNEIISIRHIQGLWLEKV
jgi:hypothetical protein